MPESFSDSGEEPLQEILKRIKDRAEAGFGPARDVLAHLIEEANGLGMSVEDYLEIKGNLAKVAEELDSEDDRG